jgi:uncharacterized protein
LKDIAMVDLSGPSQSQLDVTARTRVVRFVPRLLLAALLAIAFNCLPLPRLEAVGAVAGLTFAAIFIGSLAAGLAGFAFSAVTGALLFHWLAPADAVPLLLAGSITTQLFSITALRRTMRWKACGVLLLGGLPGIPVGAYLLQHVGGETIAASFGVFLIGYALFMLWRPVAVVAGGGCGMALMVGFAGGISGGAIAFPGAFPAIWCSLRGLPKDAQRGIVQPFILLMQCAALAYFSRAGMLGSATAVAFLWCAPAALAGTFVGVRLYHCIDDAIYRRVILGFLLVSGVAFIM